MTTSPGKKTLSTTQRIDNERIYLLYKQSPIGIAATVFNGVVCAFILRDLIAPTILKGWIGALLAISLVRLLLVLHYHRNADSTLWASRYKFWNIFTLALSGAVWGTSAILLFPPASVAHQLFLAIVTIGMVAGATMAFSIFESAFVAFAAPTLLPITVRFLASNSELHVVTGILGLFLFLLSFFVSRNLKKSRVQFLQLKETLDEQVTQKTEALRKTNARLKAENQRRAEIQSQLEETRKFEAIANLAGGIAHQFNNALAVIMGNTELLKMDHPENDQIDAYIEPITEASAQMSQLTTQLLAYAKGGRYKTQPHELGDLVATALSTIQHDWAPHVIIHKRIESPAYKVEVDTTQMQMVISAIVTNAAEAINHQGTVNVICRSTTLDAPLIDRHGELPPGDYMIMEVQDYGAGMNEDILQRIFEPFFSTKFQGRGLGMAAVFGIVKNHHGHIQVFSLPGQGTRVLVFLPAVAPSPLKAVHPTVRKPAHGNKRVLLVEDEKMVMAVSQKLLERLGYKVIKAFTGREAVDLIDSQMPHVDLVLLDLKLPDMNGASIVPVVRKHLPDAKVIISSGYSLEDRTQELLDQGADGVIQKPFTLESIYEKIDQVLTPADDKDCRNKKSNQN